MINIFLDCDQTLYQNMDLMQAIRDRMVHYMVKILGKPLEEMVELRKAYLRAYGTTLAGLMRHQGIDPYDYMRFVHEVDASGYIERDDALRRLLLSLGLPIHILSNAPKDHVEKVLRLVGLEGIFGSIYTIEAFNFEGKPNRSCFEKVCRDLGLEPSECWLIDDDPQNLEGAKDFGFKTCLVGDGEDGIFDLRVSNIKEIEKYKELLSGSNA